MRDEKVDEWTTLFDETYGTGEIGKAPSFVGWNSSYTKTPLPEEEMREWLAGTTQRIAALNPDRVLEIGCGVGLLLQQLAPGCQVYRGTDISAAGIAALRRWLAAQQGLQHVELLQRDAARLDDMEPGSFDTVILNSVIQYFPDIDYLVAVLEQAARLVPAGGRIFVGDIRHFGLLPAFHASVQLAQAPRDVERRATQGPDRQRGCAREGAAGRPGLLCFPAAGIFRASARSTSISSAPSPTTS